jgi:hypothetical protein
MSENADGVGGIIFLSGIAFIYTSCYIFSPVEEIKITLTKPNIAIIGTSAMIGLGGLCLFGSLCNNLFTNLKKELVTITIEQHGLETIYTTASGLVLARVTKIK